MCTSLGVSGISIESPGTVTMGKTYAFTCNVACYPSCSFTWDYMGKTFQGDQTEIPILHKGERRKFVSHQDITFSEYSKIEHLTCVATNSISGASINATVELTVIGESAAWLPLLILNAKKNDIRWVTSCSFSPRRPNFGACHL